MNWLDLTKLPTNNFYAFLTLLGLCLLVFSLGFPLWWLSSHSLYFDQIQRDRQLLDLDCEVEFTKIVRQNHENPQNARYAPKSSLAELRDGEGFFTEKGLELQKRRIELGYRRNISDEDLKQIITFDPLFKLLSVLGLALLTIGSLAWFSRQQKPSDMQLKNEAAKGVAKEQLIIPASLDEVLIFGLKNRVVTKQD